MPKEESRTEVESLRKAVMIVKEHLDVESYTKSPFAAAEVMRQYLAALPEPLLTFELYDSFLIALTFVELEDRLDYWRLLLSTLPPGFKATTEKMLSLLNHLHTHATGQFPANGNYAANLAPVFAPIFLRPRFMTPHMTNDAKLTTDALQHLIENVPSLYQESLLTSMQNTPRRPNTPSVPTPVKLSTLPRSLRSSPPGSPSTKPIASTSTVPSSSHPVPERRQRKTAKRTPQNATTDISASAPQKENKAEKDLQEDKPILVSEAQDSVLKNGDDSEAVTPTVPSATEAHNKPDETAPVSDGPATQSEEVKNETNTELEKPPSDTERVDDQEGVTSDIQEADVEIDPAEAYLTKGLDEQILRIERYCEDLSTHLYDAAMNFERARTTAKTLRQLCQAITKFFARIELDLPGGDLTDDEVGPDEDEDEGRLLMLITQIKHMMSQIQAHTQLLSDAFDQSEEETQKRRLIRECVGQVADRLHSLAHPHLSAP